MQEKRQRVKPLTLGIKALVAIIVSLVTDQILTSVISASTAWTQIRLGWSPQSNIFDFSPSVLALCWLAVIPIAGISAFIVYSLFTEKSPLARVLLGGAVSGLLLWILFAGFSQIEWLIWGFTIGVSVNSSVLITEVFWRFLTTKAD